MSDALSRRTALLTALIAVSVLALLLALAMAASAQDDDASEEPTEEPTDEDATEEPADEDATEEPADDDEALVQGLEALLTDEDVEADALYQAFVQFLVSEYDTTVELDDDVLSIQIDLDQLGR